MTKVYYMVGEHRYETLKMAKIAASFSKKHIMTCYEKVTEKSKKERA